MIALLYIVGIGCLVAGLLLLLRHEFARIERERRMREWLARNPQFERIEKNLVALRIEVRDHFSPAMRIAARGIAEFEARLRKDKP